jgi:sarcosine oxidase
MAERQRVIVLGLGIAGSSIAATLARRGYAVTGIEQFSALHERGSSHGDTRIFRRVPHEGDVYVGLAAASLTGWQEWNALARDPLLVECRGIDAGPEGSAMVASAAELCLRYDQPFERMSGAAWNRRYEHFNLPADWQVVFQPQSGVVRPDATRLFLHAVAREAGARLLHESRVSEVDASGEGVRVKTAEGWIEADSLVVSAGSWLPGLFPDLKPRLVPERRVTAWHRPLVAEPLLDGRLPIFCLDADGGWYGMPTPDGRLKMGHDKHLRQRINHADEPLAPNADDAALLETFVRTYMKGFEPEAIEMKACIYTIAEDHHFVIDRHPEHANVLLFSCCSGHGFKYAPVYGEIAADLIAGKARPELAQFGLSRSAVGIRRFS